MSWLTNFIPPRIRHLVSKRDIPENLWCKCPGCEQMLLRSDLKKHLFTCPHCQYHMKWPVKDRLETLFDNGNYRLLDVPHVKDDPLQFRDQKRYIDRLKESRQKTGQRDAVLLTHGTVSQKPCVAACFDFDFIGGSMGLAAGEALVRGTQWAIAQRIPFIVFSSSGGARMQEGVLSLMQMPRSVLSVLQLKENRLPFISFLTHPTTGGVAASFASLGTITLAEPGAVIGFTGARVIQETLRQPLPPLFQRSEFQKDHGFIDDIVPRPHFRSFLAKLLTIFSLAEQYLAHGQKEEVGQT